MGIWAGWGIQSLEVRGHCRFLGSLLVVVVRVAALVAVAAAAAVVAISFG